MGEEFVSICLCACSAINLFWLLSQSERKISASTSALAQMRPVLCRFYPHGSAAAFYAANERTFLDSHVSQRAVVTHKNDSDVHARALNLFMHNLPTSLRNMSNI